mmetsp:Transcript_27754/g.81578  ORF Transcript_27754/g.81578 Transcript_27754/m.81578 type:complete len:446 (+) Transcript_27754:178-1515(+)
MERHTSFSSSGAPAPSPSSPAAASSASACASAAPSSASPSAPPPSWSPWSPAASSASPVASPVSSASPASPAASPSTAASASSPEISADSADESPSSAAPWSAASPCGSPSSPGSGAPSASASALPASAPSPPAPAVAVSAPSSPPATGSGSAASACASSASGSDSVLALAATSFASAPPADTSPAWPTAFTPCFSLRRWLAARLVFAMPDFTLSCTPLPMSFATSADAPTTCPIVFMWCPSPRFTEVPFAACTRIVSCTCMRCRRCTLDTLSALRRACTWPCTSCGLPGSAAIVSAEVRRCSWTSAVIQGPAMWPRDTERQPIARSMVTPARSTEPTMSTLWPPTLSICVGLCAGRPMDLIRAWKQRAKTPTAGAARATCIDTKPRITTKRLSNNWRACWRRSLRFLSERLIQSSASCSSRSISTRAEAHIHPHADAYHRSSTV